MTNITVDKLTIEEIAMEMSSGMIVAPVLAKKLQDLVATAKPSPDPDLFADMVLEIRSFGDCRGAVHRDPKKPCECRYCRIIRRIES